MLSLISLISVGSLSLTSSAFLCSDKNAKTLLKIKEAFADSPSVASWDISSDCCTWPNIICGGEGDGNGTILQISISKSSYSGPIPEAIGEFHDLTNLFIEGIPNLSGPIPPFFANFTSLITLNIHKGSLSGSIPSFFCNMRHMHVMDLPGNRLTGSIPGCLKSDFAFFDLSGNQLSGPIPARLYNSSSIFSGSIGLDLHDNQLTGEIPKSFRHVKFYQINLSGNRLTGDASALFGTSKTARSIDLSRNEFKFDLSSVKFPPLLMSLNISHNRIHGRIPKYITKVEYLSDVDVSYNKLCGPIPSGGGIENGGSVSNLSPSAFEHNKCLCGHPLPPCNVTAGN